MAINPTQNGIAPVRGLNRLQQPMTPEQAEALRLQQERARIKHGINTAYRPEVGTFTESKHYEPGTAGYEFGLSKYDNQGNVINPIPSMDDLQQRRSENQPWWDRLGNGLAKFAGRASTSFINGVLGAPIGIAYASISGDASKLWDNPFANAMADVDKWFDENFVNYRSLNEQQNEKNGEWWKNLSSMNTWMDDVLTNVGFTVGMIGSAMLGGGIGGAAVRFLRGASALAARSSQGLLGTSYKLMNRALSGYGKPFVNTLSIVNSSMGESALEGLNTKREMVDEETARINSAIDNSIMNDPEIQQLDSSYQQQLDTLDQVFSYDRSSAEYQQYRQQIDQQYQQRRDQLSAQYEQHRNAALQQLDENATRAGNAVVGLNLAILIPSNFNLAGRFVSKAFRDAERSAARSWAVKGGMFRQRNAFGQRYITGSVEDGYKGRSFIGSTAKRIGSNMLSEGIYEEMGQGAVSTGAKKYHAYGDPDNYWRARLDPDSVDLAADGSHDFLSALGYGLKETYGSAEGWKEGFIGGLTGALFGAGEMRDEWRNTRFAKQTAKQMNEHLQSDKLPNLLRHVIAGAFHEGNKSMLAEEGNQNDWKTEDDKALFSLISSFARAGRMDDLHAMIEQHAADMSDEEIQSILDGAVAEVTPEMQRAQLKASINEDVDKQIASLLKEGAENEPALRAAVDNAALAEQQARQQAAQVMPELGSANEKTIRKYARAKGEVGAAAKQVLDAIKAKNSAQREYDLAMESPESKAKVEELEEQRQRRLNAADNTVFDSYWEGPTGLVDNNGNRASVAQAREHLKHNVDRMRESVKRYQDSIEAVNRKSFGILSKDQEDYLAYLKFLGGTHAQRAEELISKWRGVLPDTIAIRHDNPATIAKRYKLPESAVIADPNREGWLLINTKDFTDEQFGRMMLNDLIRNNDVTVVDQDENEIAEETEKARKSIYEEALQRLREDSARSGKQKDFDREEFERDMNDVEACFEKTREYNMEFDKAMMNPEGILTARDRAIRYLRNKYQDLREKLRSRELTDEEIANLDEDGLRRLDKYRFDKEVLRRLLKAIDKFLDDRLSDVGEKAKNSIESQLNKYGILVDDVLSLETQKRVLTAVKERIKDNIDAVRNGTRISTQTAQEEDGAVPAMHMSRQELFEIGSDEIQGMIDEYVENTRAELEREQAEYEAEEAAREAKAAETTAKSEEGEKPKSLKDKLKEFSKDGTIIIDGVKVTAENLADVVRDKYISEVVRRIQNENWQKNFINSYNKLVDFFKDRFAKIRDTIKEKTGVDVNSSWSTLKGYADRLLHKISDQDLIKIEDLRRIAKQQLDSLESKGKAASTLAKNLRQLLKTIDSKVQEFMSKKQRDTDPVNYPPENPGHDVPDSKNKRQQEDDTADDADEAAGTSDTAHMQSPSMQIELEAVDKDATTPFHIRFAEESPGTNIWQSVTGEFARRSGFTYKPYHEIVNNALKGDKDGNVETDDGKKPVDKLKDTDYVIIRELGDKGNRHTLADWKELARRSEIVRDRLVKEGTLGYIDTGAVTVGEKIGFLIEHDPEVGFIVYLTHNGKPIADLNYPKFSKGVEGLQEMYDIFKKEYESAESTEGGVTSKYHTSVNNVFAGFPRYNNKDDKGVVPTNTVESISENKQVRFAVNKGNGLDDSQFEGDTVVFGRGAVGQPFVLLETPGQRGMTRFRAIPVYTQPFGNNSIEADVIRVAAKKAMSLGKERGEDFLQKFLMDFLNCRNVFVSIQTVQQDAGNGTLIPTEAIKIDVVTRDMDTATGKRVKTGMWYYNNSGTLHVLDTRHLRANVSHAFLEQDSARTTSYEQVASTDPSLPQTYTEFLKKVCHTKLADTKTHNSWITVNRLSVDDNGVAHEEHVAPVAKRTVWKTTGQSVVTLRDPFTSETYKITVKKDETSRIPKIASINYSVGGAPLEYTNLTQANKDRLLDIIAKAIMEGADGVWGEQNSFSINGLIYEFKTNAKGRKIEHPTMSEAGLDTEALDKELNDALAQAAAMYDSLSSKQLYEQFFYENTISKDPEMQDTLRRVIAARKRGRKKFGNISIKKRARLLNALRPISKDQSTKAQITQKIIDHLRKFHIRVSLNAEEGQRHVTTVMNLLKEGKRKEAAEYSEKFGISFFIGPDNETVYGFAGKSGIWLDPNLLNPESLVHEYTHLWSYMLRNSGNKEHQKMWNSLVADLRDNHTDLWNKIKQEYPWLRTDDEIADEVFARMSGEDGQRRIEEALRANNSNVECTMKSLRSLFLKFVDYIKSILGLKANAERMSDLVFADMLSNNPLNNFDTIADEYTAEPLAHAEPEDVADDAEKKGDTSEDKAGKSYKLSQLIYDDDDLVETLTDAGFRVEGDTVFLDGKSEDELKALGISIYRMSEFHIALSDSTEASARKSISGTYVDNVLLKFNSDPTFDGASRHIDGFEFALTRNRIDTDDFLFAVGTMLNEQQRELLWNLVKYSMSGTSQRYHIAAKAQSLFEAYMRGEADALPSGVGSIFGVLHNGIQSIVSHRSDVEALDRHAATSAEKDCSLDGTPQDAFTTLSADERRLAELGYLDYLTQADEQLLESAGYSATLYKALPEDAKEYIRKCVL